MIIFFWRLLEIEAPFFGNKNGLNKKIFTGRGIRLSGDTVVCLVEQIDYRSVRCVSEVPWKSVGVPIFFNQKKKKLKWKREILIFLFFVFFWNDFCFFLFIKKTKILPSFFYKKLIFSFSFWERKKGKKIEKSSKIKKEKFKWKEVDTKLVSLSFFILYWDFFSLFYLYFLIKIKSKKIKGKKSFQINN